MRGPVITIPLLDSPGESILLDYFWPASVHERREQEHFAGHGSFSVVAPRSSDRIGPERRPPGPPASTAPYDC